MSTFRFVLRDVRDRTLPPDHAAFVAAEPPTGRVIVIAPTRAACETIELALGLRLETLLEREHGAEIRELARAGRGFGIVAGTGTGKTLAIRPIAEEILRPAALRVGVVNREREATPETPSWNVIIVTTGIARRWFEDGDILPADTLVVDEIHQTSAELELCLALGKRVGCRFIWLSATVDPTFYARYLVASAVLHTRAFDPAKAATVRVLSEAPSRFLSDRFLQQVMRRRRGVGLFLPTRAAVEEAAAQVGHRFPRIHTAFYHGGEPIRVIRAFLEEGTPRPFLLAMTAAGQSALNVKGLDTVVIDDTRVTNVVERGRNVLTRTHLGANEILQMAGRVHGRVAGGEVFILSDRALDFGALEPTAPEFQLAGDSERVAITCAALGVRADELELPVPLDRRAYREAVAELESRGIIEAGRLTRYGKLVEATPVERPWAELLVHADDALVPYLAVMASAESLHRMTREERDLSGLVVSGSDHLTAYNVYAEAVAKAGYLGKVYGLPRHQFDEGTIDRWAERRGVLIKAIEDTALAMASVCRSLEVELPATLPLAAEDVRRRFCELVARVMPFDLVIDEETADGQEARVSKTSVCGSWGAIAGTLRYFADRFGVPRGSIEGTQLPMSLVRRHAMAGPAELLYDARRARDALVLQRRVEYFGFELEREEEAIETFPPGEEVVARRVLARALARGEARHPAVRRHAPAVAAVRELHRRSGGLTPRLTEEELAAMYEQALAGVGSMSGYRAAPLRLDIGGLVPPALRSRFENLPTEVEIRGKRIEIEYDLEEDREGTRSAGGGAAAPEGAEGDGGDGMLPVARLRLPEKMARTLSEEELPRLDRPLRFVVTRGPRGAVRAASLAELQEQLERPWSPEELAQPVRDRRPGDRDAGGRSGRGGGARRRDRHGGSPRRHR
ncbi:MAG TPA: DEAD/DEAH box helicase [Gemmatimonadaceae bacterium]|nr:DEAD/DEAH box helicase [Gemmatimonadaceae bacterium]